MTTDFFADRARREREFRESLAPGLEVAILNTGGWHSRIVGTSTIEKVLKTQVVLADGRRFKVSDLHEHGGRSKHYADQIVATDDPRIAQIKAAKVVQDAESKAHTAVDGWVKGSENRRNVEKISAAVAALENLRAVLLAHAEEDED